MKKIKRMMAILAAAAVMSGCGPFVDMPVIDEGRPVEILGLYAGQLVDGKAVLIVGDKMYLRVQLNAGQGVAQIVFMSTDESVVTVTLDGVVEAVGPGQAEIFAFADSNSSVLKGFTVTVTDDKLIINEDKKVDQAQADARRR